jgi:hypothetical protein
MCYLWSQMKISLYHGRSFMSRIIPYHCNTPITSNKVRTKVKIQIVYQQADESGGGSRCELAGPGGTEGGPGPKFVSCVFVFLCITIIC